MQGQLFLDSLSLMISQFETAVTAILIHPKRTSQKIQLLTEQLLTHKNRIMESICTLFKPCKEADSLRTRLQQEIAANTLELRKYRLHLILKKKLERAKRQSLVNNDITQLQESVLMIQKNLGIQPEQDARSQAVSRLINRSLLGLDDTPIRHHERSHSQASITMDLRYADMSIEMTESNIINTNTNTKTKTNTNSKAGQQDYPEKSKTTQTPTQQQLSIPSVKKKKRVQGDKPTNKPLLGNLLEESYHSCIAK